MMRLIERAAYNSMPWKNGLGATTQIAIYPADASIADFGWRISMAVVNSNGPFSQFPGIERSLAVLEGAGIALAFADGKTARLTRNSAPFAFSADIQTEATLIDGPIRDLNVMSRRGDFSHDMQAFSGPAEFPAASGTIVIFAHGAALRVEDGIHSLRVALGDTAIREAAPQGLNIIPEGSGTCYIVQFSETGSPG
jgi:environmental stress-induced protein Ves